MAAIFEQVLLTAGCRGLASCANCGNNATMYDHRMISTHFRITDMRLWHFCYRQQSHIYTPDAAITPLLRFPILSFVRPSSPFGRARSRRVPLLPFRTRRHIFRASPARTTITAPVQRTGAFFCPVIAGIKTKKSPDAGGVGALVNGMTGSVSRLWTGASRRTSHARSVAVSARRLSLHRRARTPGSAPCGSWQRLFHGPSADRATCRWSR